MRDSSPSLMIRVKLVNLNHDLRSREGSLPKNAATAPQVSALVGSISERNPKPLAMSTIGKGGTEPTTNEICLKTRRAIPQGEFEDHIESCAVCANKVELQLDFIETLEVAIYQRRAEVKAHKVRGALLVSNPEMNFAICGELEF